MGYFIMLFFAMATTAQSPTFKDKQLTNSRVESAYREKENELKQLFAGRGMDFEGFHIFVRGFKKEKELEVWAKEKEKSFYQLLITYPFCSTSGTLGPKRREGDGQIPEGIYYINHFNPLSNFHLSLGINYPNASDRILSDRKQPGGSIYIHGNCVTIGCIPITDDKIKELYILGIEARTSGQEKIPVHIFPERLDLGTVEGLAEGGTVDLKVKDFWKNLQTIYLDFKTTSKLRLIKVNQRGEYYF